MKNLKTTTRILRHSFGTLALTGLAVLGATLLAPGCNVSSCADTNTCGAGDDSMGGQGGEAGEGPDRDNPGRSEGGAGGATDGKVEIECGASELACDGACIDPMTDLKFCGASGSCQGKKAGTACEGDDICFEGECTAECSEDSLRCDGTCVDPMSDNDHCGADACGMGDVCDSDEQCISGRCAGWIGGRTTNWVIDDFNDSLEVGIDGNGVATVGFVEGSTFGQVNSFSSTYNVTDHTWSNRTTRDTTSQEADSSVVAVNENGKVEFAWRQATGGEPKQIWSSGHNGNENWWAATERSGENAGPVATLATATPDLAIDDAGTTFLAWRQQNAAGQKKIWMNVRLAETTSWDLSPVSVSPIGDEPGDARIPVIAPIGPGAGGGSALVVYREVIGGQRRLVYTTLSPIGSTDGAEVTTLATDGDVIDYATAGDSAGRAAVVWTIETALGVDQVWVSLYSDGDFLQAVQLTEEETATLDEPQVAIDASGSVHVFWRKSTATQEYATVAYNPLSETWTSPEVIHPVAATVTSLSVDTDAFGNLQAAWIADRDGADSVWTARRDAFSGVWSTASLLENSEDNLESVRLAVNDEGRIMVVWWNADDPTEMGWNYLL